MEMLSKWILCWQGGVHLPDLFLAVLHVVEDFLHQDEVLFAGDQGGHTEDRLLEDRDVFQLEEEHRHLIVADHRQAAEEPHQDVLVLHLVVKEATHHLDHVVLHQLKEEEVHQDLLLDQDPQVVVEVAQDLPLQEAEVVQDPSKPRDTVMVHILVMVNIYLDNKLDATTPTN